MVEYYINLVIKSSIKLIQTSSILKLWLKKAVLSSYKLDVLNCLKEMDSFNLSQPPYTVYCARKLFV